MGSGFPSRRPQEEPPPVLLQVHSQPAPPSLCSRGRLLLVWKSKGLLLTLPLLSAHQHTHTHSPASSSLPSEPQHPLLGASSPTAVRSAFIPCHLQGLPMASRHRRAAPSTTRLSGCSYYFYLFSFTARARMVKGPLERFLFLNSGGRGEDNRNNTPEAFMALYCIILGYGKGHKHIYFIPVNLL